MFLRKNLQSYLFREYFSKTILNHHFDRLRTFSRLCPEKMPCMIAGFLSFHHVDIILIFIIKSLHGTFQYSVFVPVYRIRSVPIPDVGYHIVFLAFKFSRLVEPELIIGRTACRFVTPLHIVTFHFYHQVTVRRSATVHVSCPPCTAGSSDIMFINSRRRLLILIEMCVSRKNMNLIRS